MVRTVLGAVMMVMVFAVVVMLAVVVAGRIVGAVLGDGGSGAPDGEGQCDGERRGYARYELHSCLLTRRVSVVTRESRGRVFRGYAYPAAEVQNGWGNMVGW
jgi:hypothetical protein